MNDKNFMYAMIVFLLILEMVSAAFMWMTVKHIRGLQAEVEALQTIDEYQGRLSDEFLRGMQTQGEFNHEVTSKIIELSK